MSLVTLHANILALLQTISTLQEVSTRPTFQFSGFPACFIAESGNQNDFEDQQNNLRVYSWNVWLFQEFDKTSVDDAYSILRTEVDNIVGKFDAQESPTSSRSLADNLPAGYTLVKVWATPAEFAYDEKEKLLGARINIRCSVLVDLTTL